MPLLVAANGRRFVRPQRCRPVCHGQVLRRRLSYREMHVVSRPFREAPGPWAVQGALVDVSACRSTAERLMRERIGRDDAVCGVCAEGTASRVVCPFSHITAKDGMS